MIKNIEEPCGISYVALRSKPYKEEQNRFDQEWEIRALEAECKFFRIVFAIMAVLLAISQLTTAAMIRFV